MTNRRRFERWATRHELPLGRIEIVTGDGPKLLGYINPITTRCWQAWEAQRRHYSVPQEAERGG